jgi:hypothetical protein
MDKTGIGDFTSVLTPWKEIVDMGMSGTPEKRIEQDPRSEIHPWTAHPVHFYFSVVAGIRPVSPGFKSIEIAPNPGNLKAINAIYPTINGQISVELLFDEHDAASGIVIIPEGVKAVFKWKGESRELISGKNVI